ncbi:glycoside hydrolase family 31 protein [Niastella sp. OAS944]|uniref:glycoside hydrolase family 31 protein n=1 Tax=Niastella sp. OAS944 TaxID=2664089 RepID=UPI003492EAEC|nr:alpha-D-xyloside xylohydrolase [Chitinophagaceae bacterium OAS944]
MNNKGIILLPLLLFSLHTSFSQVYQRTSNGIKARIQAIDVEVQFYSPQIVRIIKLPIGTTTKQKSLSVIASPQKLALTIADQKNEWVISSQALQVKLNRKTAAIQFYASPKNLLLQEKEDGTHFSPSADPKSYEVVQAFQLEAGESVYGLGQHQSGIMDHRGQQVLLKQNNMQIAVPFFQSVKGYGVLWDNYSTTHFKDDAAGTSFKSEVGEGIDYYFIQGGNADKVIAGYRHLTGQAPLFPRWTLGYWQSRERYKSQYETNEVVRRYRQLHVPLDGIVQDWQYWGEDESYWNSTEFGNPRFPEPKKMVDSVHDQNAHVIISVWPSFGNKTKIHDVFKQQNMLYGDYVTWPINTNVQVYDAFNPHARDIYWQYMNKNIFSIGIDGWWLDSTEPDHFKDKESDEAHNTFLGAYRKVRNAFPLIHTGGVYKHQRETTSEKRVFILARSAFSGQQRFGTMMWSGDVGSAWDVFRKQISGGLNLSLSGLPYWNSDIGGFFSGGKYPKGVNDPAFRELYVRWLQFGTFCPMMRSHGTDTPREIYQFGAKGDWAYDAIEKFINLRYRFLPYNYSNAWQVTSHAGTMMRALVMDFPADKKVWNIDNEYMFGKSVLVCPVTDSMYTSRANGNTIVDVNTIKKQKLYLPAGTRWFDFWTGEKLAGGQEVERETPVDLMPLYIKAGSIVPMGPFQQYTNEKKKDTLEIRIYEGADGHFTLYNDEGDNYNYEKGKYAIIDLVWNDKARTLTIKDRKGSYAGMGDQVTFNIVLVNDKNGFGIDAPAKYDKVIRYTGKAIVNQLQ